MSRRAAAAAANPFKEDRSILGFLPIPTSGSWDVKIAFYRTPLTVVGTVASVTLRLSKPLPAEESAWEVRVYKMQNSQARLVAKEPCAVDPSNTAVQTAPLTNTLRVEPGHNVALVNTAGPLKIFERKLDIGANGGEKIWWSMEVPPSDVGSTMNLKSSANPFRLAWYAEIDTIEYQMGRRPLPDVGSWNITLAFYKQPMPEPALVDSVTLRLSQVLPDAQQYWEARVYSVTRYAATLKHKRRFRINPRTTDEQSIQLQPSLHLGAGQHVAIVNLLGSLQVREKQEPWGAAQSQIYWTDQPVPADVDSVVQLKRSEAPYHLGWSAQLSLTDWYHGYPFQDAQGSWEIRTAFYTIPAPFDGFVNAISLLLSAKLDAEHSRWEVRAYSMSGHNAMLRRSIGAAVDRTSTEVQHVRLDAPLFIKEGEYVALVNCAGPMKIRQQKLEDADMSDGVKIWWSSKPPSDALGSVHMMKRSEARYKLGWAAHISRFAKTPPTAFTAQPPPHRKPLRTVIGLGAKLSEQGAAGAVPNGGAHMGPGAPPSHGGPGGPGPGEVAAPNGGAPNGGAMAFGVPPGSVVHTSLGVPTVGLTGPEVVGDSTAVRNWLAILGLQDKAVGAYAKRLAADGFDTTPALATVQEEDLREAGVLKGHRRLILEAVGKLQNTRQDAVRGAAEAALEQGKSVIAAAGASAVRDGEMQSPDPGADEGEGAAAEAVTESDIEEGNVAVTIRKLDGSIVPLKVRLADRVLTAKRRLERVTSYPALDQTFIFQGRRLQDRYTLAQYGVLPDAVLQLVMPPE